MSEPRTHQLDRNMDISPDIFPSQNDIGVMGLDLFLEKLGEHSQYVGDGSMT